jgi:hypothetical protein
METRMTNKEIEEFLNLLEESWLENRIAKRYLKNSGIENPTKFLAKEIESAPDLADLRERFAPIREKLSLNLQNAQMTETVYKLLLQILKQQQN